MFQFFFGNALHEEFYKLVQEKQYQTKSKIQEITMPYTHIT